MPYENRAFLALVDHMSRLLHARTNVMEPPALWEAKRRQADDRWAQRVEIALFE